MCWLTQLMSGTSFSVPEGWYTLYKQIMHCDIWTREMYFTKQLHIDPQSLGNFLADNLDSVYCNPCHKPQTHCVFILMLVCLNERNDLYSLPNIVRWIKSRRMRWAGQVARLGERRRVYRVLVGKSEGKRPLWRPRRRWDDNIKMDLQKVWCDSMGWIELAQVTLTF